MTNREKVYKALRHEEQDILPYDFALLPELAEKVKNAIDIQKEYENCCFAYCGNGAFTETKKDYFEDEFGVVWNKTKDKDIGVVDNRLIPDAEKYSYEFPGIDEKRLRGNIESSIGYAKKTGKFVMFTIGFSMFERAWTLRGMENLLIDMIDNPDFVHKLMGDIAGYNLKLLRIALEYEDLDGFYFGDDWGQQRGLIMGISHWREFIKPNVAKMYAPVKAAGKFTLQHSCGDINQLFPDLIEIGLDAYQTFQPEIYDIEKVKREFGGKLSFWGGISTQRLLPFAKPAELKAEIFRTIKIMRKGGGYILAPTHGMPGDIPVENVVAMIEAFKEQA